MMKPIFSDIMRYLEPKVCVCNKHRLGTIHAASGMRNRKECQRCRTVYKRPYLKWHKLEQPVSNIYV